MHSGLQPWACPESPATLRSNLQQNQLTRILKCSAQKRPSTRPPPRPPTFGMIGPRSMPKYRSCGQASQPHIHRMALLQELGIISMKTFKGCHFGRCGAASLHPVIDGAITKNTMRVSEGKEAAKSDSSQPPLSQALLMKPVSRTSLIANPPKRPAGPPLLRPLQ